MTPIAAFSGLAKVMPVFATLFAFMALSSMGLPGLNGFVGEFLILIGAFEWNPVYTYWSVWGIVLAAAYRWLQPSPTPVSRGAQIAERLGCLTCHGPGATGGIANPGSEDAEVPAWDGGVAMMYVESEAEIREWILYGAPERLRAEVDAGEHDPDALVRMPAYEGRLDERELEDLVAFFKAVAAFEEWPDDAEVRQGWSVASRLGCFGCHGASGRVPMPNPGSLKGVIPAWDGADFAELVRDEEELRQWILNGVIPRLQEHPIAKRYLARQVIPMPGYREKLEEGDLDALVAYIRWLRPGGEL